MNDACRQTWEAACMLRGHMHPSEYMETFVGLMLSKYAGETFDGDDMLKSAFDKITFDTWGNVYEFCIGQFARQEGANGGEYYTPKTIVTLIAKMLKPRPGATVYDPCCGAGVMFLNFGKNISAYGQEFNPDVQRMTSESLKAAGIQAKIEQGDTLIYDAHKGLIADYVLANPPFNQSGRRLDKNDERWKYGVPSSANFAWIEHVISHMGKKAAIVLPNTTLMSVSRSERRIRENIIKEGLIEAVISLPRKMFYNTNMPSCLWILSRNNKKTLFARAREKDDLDKISDLYSSFANGDEIIRNVLCAVAGKEEIKELTPWKYLEQEAKPRLLQSELDEELENLLERQREIAYQLSRR